MINSFFIWDFSNCTGLTSGKINVIIGCPIIISGKIGKKLTFHNVSDYKEVN